MKYPFYFLFLLCSCPTFAQGIIIEKNITYGKANDFRDRPSNLKLDIVYPSKEGKSPLIVFTHGGGFSENSSKEEMLPFCDSLAKKGFVVANIEYRGGFILA